MEKVINITIIFLSDGGVQKRIQQIRAILSQWNKVGFYYYSNMKLPSSSLRNMTMNSLCKRTKIMIDISIVVAGIGPAGNIGIPKSLKFLTEIV